MVGDVTITNCEFKNIGNWAVLDSRSGSGGEGSAMNTVTFANNYVHECDGSIGFRGLSTDWTDQANIHDNRFKNIGNNFSSPTQTWAAIEINRAENLSFINNTIDGVTEGSWGEGQGLQAWEINSISITGNSFKNSHQGIWLASVDTGAVPTGSVTNNSFENIADFAVQYDHTTPLNAENNWWGNAGGPDGTNNPNGDPSADGGGDAIGDYVDANPFLTADPLINILKLEVQTDPEYMQPGETVTIDMDALNLAQHVTGCQTVLNFSSTYFLAGASEVDVQPGGGVWDELIWGQWTTGGDLDVAVGVDLTSAVGTKADGTVAKFTLTAKDNDGTTMMIFRPDGVDPEQTIFVDLAAQAVYPGSKIDSQTIVIDGTAPTMDDITPADDTCIGGTQDFVFDFADDNPLADLELDIYRPGDTQETKTQVSFPAGPISSGDAAALLSGYGASIVYDSIEQKWTLTIDTTHSYWPDGQYHWYIEVEDMAGNKWGDMMNPGAHPEMKYDWTFDNTAPVISNIVAEQGTDNSVLCPDIAIQGIVDIYVDVVDSGCSPLQQPTVTVADISPVTYVGATGDTYHYQIEVLSSTTNGSHTITVEAEDELGNASSDNSKAICVDKNQITGSVELENLADISRAVTFVSNGGTKSWTQTLSFTGSVALFTLTEVPDGTTDLSAKANWNLRVKLATPLTDGQGTADFTGGSLLRGGDLNGSNTTNILDFAVLKTNWFTTNAVADINGDGNVQLWDFLIFRSNFFQRGDDL
jgi:hypothetical protein